MSQGPLSYQTTTSIMPICLFDIDGTLLNTGGAGQAAMEAALQREFGVDDVAVHGVAVAGRTDRAITADLLEFFGLPADGASIGRFLNAYLRMLPDYLKTTPGTVLPGIPDLLETLGRREDMLLGLLTGNYREGARLKLAHYGLGHHFGFGGFGDRHHDRDDVAREALGELRHRCDGQLTMEQVWVIGDTPSDVRCGRAIGAKTFAVATGVYPAEQLRAAGPDCFVPDLSDPEPLLRLLR